MLHQQTVHTCNHRNHILNINRTKNRIDDSPVFKFQSSKHFQNLRTSLNCE